MSLFAELRRRNVLRMAALYLVGAWLIVQVSETLLPIFHTPDWVLQTLVVLLTLGLVPALVFSWVYELTPEGLKRDADVPPEQSIASLTARRMDRLLAAGLLAVVALIAADRYWPRDAVTKSTTDTGSTKVAPVSEDPSPKSTAPQSSQKSIAVLPFVNMSADAENEYFSDGISEELLNLLVRVDGIGVASRTSSFAYKGRELGAAAIAKELKVDHILEGSVRKAGNKVRITAQLIDAANDRHLWSETYDRELTDIFAIQEEIANAIVAALRGTLGGKKPEPAVTVRVDTENMQAYDIYLKARELFIARTDLRESVRLFEQVVEMDPQFARGWEGLAAVAAVVESWGIRDRDYMAMAKQAAERALELDASLSMPWAVLSMVVRRDLPIDWTQSLAHVDRAIAADPQNATAYLWRSIAWVNLGFFQRAIVDQDRCLVLDPAYQNCVRWKAVALLFEGDTEQAMALFEQGIAADFVRSQITHFIIALLARRGDRLAALLLLDRMGAKPELRDVLLAVLTEPGSPPPNAEAIVNRFLADKDDEFAQRLGPSQANLWLGIFDRVATAPDLNEYVSVHWQPGSPKFRNSPHWKRVVERLGVAAYWRAHGYPPHCRPIGEKDFECD